MVVDAHDPDDSHTNHNNHNHDNDGHDGDGDGGGGEHGGGGGGGGPVPVPGELGVLPPGSMLAELLEQLDATVVRGFDTVELLKACERQLNYQHALFYAALLETGLRAAGSADTVARKQQPDEFACEEARAALVWSRRRASASYELAFDLFCRLPELGQAMRRGQLDLARARAFITWTEGLTDTQAGQVCHQLLPDAPTLMVGELITRIQRACLAIDPDYAATKYKTAVRKRVVRGWQNPDGTGSIGGYQQPVDRVIAACERITTLARACKHAGDHRPIDLIRSDLYLRMLDGTFTTMNDTQIIAYVLANPLTPAGDTHHTDTDGSSDHTDNDDGSSDHTDGGDTDGGERTSGDDSNPDRGPGGHGPGGGAHPTGGSGGGGGDPGPRGGGHGPGGARPTRNSGGGGGAGGMPERAGNNDPAEDDDQPGPVEDDDRAEPAADDDGNRAERADDGNRAGPAPQERGAGWAVSELRVQLVMLLGRNEAPGEVPGWGFVPAWLARHLARGMHSAQWRWVVCDAHGRAVDGGLLTTRPHTTDRPARRDPRRGGGIVELAIGQADLHQLAAHPDHHGPWTPVITQIAHHHSRHATHANPGHHGHDSDNDGHNDDHDGGGARGGWSERDRDTAQARRRAPGAGLRRWLQLRDRQCAHPCCRAPAAAADIDHRIGWAAGGPTTGANLGPGCRHDHRLKDQGGWHVDQPTPGLTIWTSPLGHHYTSRPPPIIPHHITPQPRTTHNDHGPSDNWPARYTCTCMLQPCPHHQPQPQNDPQSNRTSSNTRPAHNPDHDADTTRKARLTEWTNNLNTNQHGTYDDTTPPF